MIADDRGVDSVSRKNRPVFLESLEASAMSSAKLPLGIGLWNLGVLIKSHTKFSATTSSTHIDANLGFSTSFECPNDEDNYAWGPEMKCEGYQINISKTSPTFLICSFIDIPLPSFEISCATFCIFREVEGDREPIMTLFGIFMSFLTWSPLHSMARA